MKIFATDTVLPRIVDVETGEAPETTQPHCEERSHTPSTPLHTCAETVMADDKVQGPASYFPSIEKKYGRPISEWKQVVRDAYPAKHMELVSVLKDDHGFGHGHANAVVAHTLAEDGLR